MTERAGLLTAAVAAAAFALQAVFATSAYRAGMTPLTVLVLCDSLAAAAFWTIAGVRGSPRPARRVLLAGLALGFGPFALETWAFFVSLQRMGAALATLLLYTAPAIVALAGIVSGRDRASVRRLGALAVSWGGTALVLTGGGALRSDAGGIALALTAACGYAAMLLCVERLLDRVDAFVLAALVFSGAAATLAIAGLAGGRLSLDFAPVGWLYLALLVVVSTILAETALLIALRHVGAGMASIVFLLEPVIVAALGWALFGQRLSFRQMAGGALVLGAIVLLTSRREAEAVALPTQNA